MAPAGILSACLAPLDLRLRRGGIIADVKNHLTSQNAIPVRDAEDRITFWNRGASEMYRFTREETEGQVSHDLFRTEFPEPLIAVTTVVAEEIRV
jgi:PAS domain-containing protein